MNRTHRVPVPMNPDEIARLDRVRGQVARAAFLRWLVAEFEDGAAPARQSAQDAPSAAIDPPPAPPAKQSILLPPQGRADAHGWHMRWTEKGRNWGTLEMARAGEDWKAVDLVEVELEDAGADGSRLLRFGDRSRVREGRA